MLSRIVVLLCCTWALCAVGIPGLARAQAARPGAAASGPGLPALDLGAALTGILAYTRWPTPRQPVRLCVLGGGPQADLLRERGLPRAPDQPAVAVRGVTAEAAIAQGCDALYVGVTDDATWRRIRPQLLDQPVLSICEKSPMCVTSGMVCLTADVAGQVRFDVNLDAVSRSTVRIHPQVLRLGAAQRKSGR